MPDIKYHPKFKIGDFIRDGSTKILWRVLRIDPSWKIHKWGTKTKKKVRRKNLCKHFTLDKTMMVLYGR